MLRAMPAHAMGVCVCVTVGVHHRLLSLTATGGYVSNFSIVTPVWYLSDMWYLSNVRLCDSDDGCTMGSVSLTGSLMSPEGSYFLLTIGTSREMFSPHSELSSK